VTDFLFRMVQRAAGLPTAVAAPQPPSQFHWPTPFETAAVRPVLPGVNSDARPRGSRRTMEAARPPDSAAESVVFKQRLAATTPPEPLRADSARTIETQATTSVPTPDEGIEGPVMFHPSHAMALASSQTPIGIEPLTRSRPAESTSSAPIHRENSDAAEPQPFAINLDDARPSLAAQQPSETAVWAAQEPPVRPTSIDHAARAMKETADETRPISVRTDIPARLTPALRPAPTRSARLQSRPQELPPPVEVKIGSVEIVFDQPAVQATQPAPVRPSGFAEFADLRRYATRPWTSRSR
jgi:hypothetical protein